MQLYTEYLNTRQNIINFIKKRQKRIKKLPPRHRQSKCLREVYDIAKIQISIANSMKSDVEYSLMLMEQYLPIESRLFTNQYKKTQHIALTDKNSHGYNPDGDILYPFYSYDDKEYKAIDNPESVDIDMADIIVQNTTLRQRLVIVCCFFFNMRKSDVAKYLNISPAGISKHIILACDKMREHFEKCNMHSLHDIYSIKHTNIKKMIKGIEDEFEYVMKCHKESINHKLSKYDSNFYKIIQDDYTGQIKHIAQCSSGHKYTLPILSSGALAYTERCPKCLVQNKKPNPITHIEKAFKREGYQLLSHHYAGRDTPLLYKCPNGHYHHTTWHNFKVGRRCWYCFVDSGESTYYTLSKAYKYTNVWRNTQATVYIVELYDDNESFYKIGISCNLENRLSVIPYKHKILKLYHTNLYDAIHLEKNLLRYHKEFAYEPCKSFGGQYECFSHIKLNLP